MSLLLLILYVISLVVGWLAVFVVVPSAMRALLRGRLWALSDEIVDNLRSGALSAEAAGQTSRLYREVQIALRFASELTPAKLVVFNLIHHGVRTEYKGVDLEALADRRERNQLKRVVDDFHTALSWHLVLGSPSGWLIMLLLVPVFGGLLILEALWALAMTLRLLAQRPRRVRGWSAARVWKGILATVEATEERLRRWTARPQIESLRGLQASAPSHTLTARLRW